jgi:light-regulated signal transduction histidine kinase (bacteriophytochrome)
MVVLFQNLIGNAIKFRGEVPPKIHINTDRRDAEYIFIVCDNGIGFEPEYNELIFQIFQRLYSEDEYPGTGIGLAICKKIVELHEGSIWTKSELGKGSQFYFTLPIIRED